MLIRVIWFVPFLLHISSSESPHIESSQIGNTNLKLINKPDHNLSDQVSTFHSQKQFSGKVDDQDSTIQLMWRKFWSESHENVETNSGSLTHGSSKHAKDEETATNLDSGSEVNHPKLNNYDSQVKLIPPTEDSDDEKRQTFGLSSLNQENPFHVAVSDSSMEYWDDDYDEKSQEEEESEDAFAEDSAKSKVNDDTTTEELVPQVYDKFFTSPKWKQNGSLCQERLDMYILLNTSDRIEKSEFVKLKEFLVNLVITKSQRSKIGIITVTNKTEIIIPVSSKYLNDELLVTRILGIQQNVPNISNEEAIMETIQLMRKNTQIKSRGTPQVIAVFSSTPTTNTEFYLVKALANLFNFTVVVVQVGNIVTNSQEKVNSAGYFNLASFNELNPDFLTEFKSHLCTIPQIPKVNEKVTDELKKGEIRYFSFDIPEESLVIRLQITAGSIRGSHNHDPIKNMSLTNNFQIKHGDDALNFSFVSSSGKSTVQFIIEGDAVNTTSLYYVKSSTGKLNHGSEVFGSDASHSVDEAFTSTNSTESCAQIVVNNFSSSLMLVLVFWTLASV